MLAKLKYVEGAIPGRPLKRKSENKAAVVKDYESRRPERKFNPKWQINRPWLVHNATENTMTCTYCTEMLGKSTDFARLTPNPKSSANPFVSGCTNFRVSAVADHEMSSSHRNAAQQQQKKSLSGVQLLQTDAGKALVSLQKAERDRLYILFRNAHAVLKNNRPLRDYVWLCKLDAAKSIDVGKTYINEKAVLTFTESIATAVRNEIIQFVSGVKFLSVLMDGSTDVSGDEQETIYLRMAKEGEVFEKFLAIGSPESTCSSDLKEFLFNTLEKYGIDKVKIVGVGSDGASNMVGKHKGLISLMRLENPDIINVHCYAHRLELAFRDVLKKMRLFDKLMTLLIGLYYYYTKQHKNKHGLQRSIGIFGGVLPTKVTGTKWLRHLHRGIEALLRTYKAYESHLSTASHSNAKAEGLAKLLTSKDLVCFTLFLQCVLDPLMRLSLKLQRPESNAAECLDWVKSTIDILEDLKFRDSSKEQNIVDSGMYEGIKLRGNTTLSYTSTLIDGFIGAIKERFSLENVNESNDVIGSTHLLHLKSWPYQDSVDFKDFGKREVTLVVNHFHDTLMPHCRPFSDKDNPNLLKEVIGEWETLKRVLYERYGKNLRLKTWRDVYDDSFPVMMVIIDLLLTIPTTSVQCETTFSQMKLVKTSRRYKLHTGTLNDLLMVKLMGPSV